MILKKTIILFLVLINLAAFGQKTRETIKFDFGWRFNLGDIYKAKEPGFDDSEWRKLDLPHDWSIEQEFKADFASCTGYLPGGIGWYRKTFDVPESYKGKTVTIQFDGVYNNSEVWINGHYLGLRPYGYISFYNDITAFLELGKKNVISVRVDHSKYADTRWYSGSGIYRHVWLNITSLVHVAQWGTYVTTPEVSKESATVKIKTTIANDAKSQCNVKLISTVISAEGRHLAKAETDIQLTDNLTQASQTINLPNPVLWDIDNPALYTLKSEIVDGKSAIDEYETKFGIRTLEFNPDKGIFLNGKNVIRQIDPSKPVTMALANIGNSRRIGLPEVLDIVGYNYTESRYEVDHKGYPGQFIYGSENPHNYEGWLAVKNYSFISSQFLWTGVDYLGEAGKFPVRSAYSGLLDLTGHEKSIYYWRQSMWSDKPMLYITARKKQQAENPSVDPMGKLSWFVSAIEENQHWNYQAGDSILVMAYTNCPEAELFLNGKSAGKKYSNPLNSSIWWYVPYQPGEVQVIAKSADGMQFQSFLKTVSAPAAINISADSKTIKADGQDISIIEVLLMDKNNHPAYLVNDRVDFEVTGEGKIIGTDNGDAACLDNMKLPWRKVQDGRCIAIVQSNGNKWKIRILAKVKSIPEAVVEVMAE